MIIIGAGLSGLLCGALNPGSMVYEAGPERPSDHQALFRCKSDKIGKVLGIPFKKVKVHKSIWSNGEEVNPTPRIAHSYSYKVTGKITGRSIFDISSGVRFIPPVDFIDRLKSMCRIEYKRPFTKILYKYCDPPIVSTIPMFKLLDILEEDNYEDFDYQPIYVNTFEIPNCDSHCTIYYPDPNFSAYRASLVGSKLIIEGMQEIQNPDIEEIRESLGIPFELFPARSTAVKSKQHMGKINIMDSETRKRKIFELTVKYNIYSLGRFATWRPKVMLDDVFEDIYRIRELIQGGNYEAKKYRQNEDG